MIYNILNCLISVKTQEMDKFMLGNMYNVTVNEVDVIRAFAKDVQSAEKQALLKWLENKIDNQ